MNERNDSVRSGIPFRTSSPARLKLVLSGVACAAALAVVNGSIAGVRAADMTAAPVRQASAPAASIAAGAVSMWSSETSRRAAAPPPARHVASPAPSTRVAVTPTPAAVPQRRNRLVGTGLDVRVSTYSDCTGRTPLPRTSVAIDLCVTTDMYFVGHSFGGPFTGLRNAHNGETSDLVRRGRRGTSLHHRGSPVHARIRPGGHTAARDGRSVSDVPHSWRLPDRHVLCGIVVARGRASASATAGSRSQHPIRRGPFVGVRDSIVVTQAARPCAV